MRDNDKVADSLGKNLRSLRTGMLLLGGAIAGLSGGVLVSFISVWSPAAWTYAETIVLFAAVIIGGRGNHLGAVLGAVIVPVGFEESTRLISNANPSLPPNLLPSLQWVAIGLLIACFLWFRPQGVLPERKRVIALARRCRRQPRLARRSAGNAGGADNRPGWPGQCGRRAGRGPGDGRTERRGRQRCRRRQARTSSCKRSRSAGTSAACTRYPASRWRCDSAP